MNCPRCGGPVSVYRLGDEESRVCEDCEYVGIEADHRSEPDSTESWDEALARFRERFASASAPAAADAEAAVRGLDLPGSGETLERRRDAVRVLYETLRVRGEATPEELMAHVDPEALGYASESSFWSNTGRAGLRSLPGVRPPTGGDPAWRFDPEAADGDGAAADAGAGDEGAAAGGSN